MDNVADRTSYGKADNVPVVHDIIFNTILKLLHLAPPMNIIFTNCPILKGLILVPLYHDLKLKSVKMCEYGFFFEVTMEQKIKSDTEINIGKNIHDLRKAKQIRQKDMVREMQLRGLPITREAYVKNRRWQTAHICIAIGGNKRCIGCII